MSGRFGKYDPNVTKDGEILTLSKIPSLDQSVDAFGNLLARNTTNEADIGSQYNYSPERQRLYLNGERVHIQYGEGGSIFNDTVDSFELTPNQGDVLKLTTAERFRYIVGYVIRPSFSYKVSRQLEDGDKIVVGYGDADLENNMANADGWFFIYTPDLEDKQVEIAEYRLGEKVSSSIVDVNKAINVWKRMAIWINWYNVGINHFQETFTDNGQQHNPIVGSLAVDDDKGPASANQRVEFAIQRASDSSPITLEIGSVGVETLGDVGVIKRQKVSTHNHTFSSTAVNNDEWEPILAIRNNPDNPNVYNELLEIFITEWDGTDDCRLVAKAHHQSKVYKSGDVELEDSDFSPPSLHNEFNSAIQVSTAVTKAADNTGSIVATTENPGGYQIGFTQTRSTGSGNNRETTRTKRQIKRSIHNGDIIVIWGNADSTDNLDYEIVIEQDW